MPKAIPTAGQKDRQGKLQPLWQILGGCEYIDEVERLAIERAKQLFGAGASKVHPCRLAGQHGSLFCPGKSWRNSFLALELAHGGHLTLGHPLSFSGMLYNVIHYTVRPDTEQFDYDIYPAPGREEHKPKMILTGASAYPRAIDFAKFGKLPINVGANSCGLWHTLQVWWAAGLHQNPVPYADV